MMIIQEEMFKCRSCCITVLIRALNKIYYKERFSLVEMRFCSLDILAKIFC